MVKMNNVSLEEVVHHLPESFVLTSTDGVVEMINPAFTNMTGYTQQEIYGQHIRILKSGRHDLAFYREMWKKISRADYWEGEIWNRRKDGTLYAEWLCIKSLKDESGQIKNYLGLSRDITVAKTSQQRLQFLAFHDPLTNLPNRTLFMDRLKVALTKVARHHQYLAILYIDLDGFKAINDSFGHECGDQILKILARRLSEAVREEDTVGRLGGDEFGIILSEISELATIEKVVTHLIASTSKPYHIGKKFFNLNASIGVAVAPDQGQDPLVLLRKADEAMYRVKQQHKQVLSDHPSL